MNNVLPPTCGCDIINDVIKINDPTTHLIDDLNYLIELSKSTIRNWYYYATNIIQKHILEKHNTEIHINKCIIGDDMGQELFLANLIDFIMDSLEKGLRRWLIERGCAMRQDGKNSIVYETDGVGDVEIRLYFDLPTETNA